MLTKTYRRKYEEAFKRVLRESPWGHFDESALPSYTHSIRFMSWLFWKRIDMALTIAGDVRNKSVLDFGCGGGVTFRYLADRHCKIVGCDNRFHDLARDICAGLGITAEICRDITEIGDRKFDLIVALDVLEHIDDLDDILEGFLSMSNANTILVISGPTENVFYRAGRRLAGFSGHYHKRNIYDIEETLKAKDLKCRTVRTLYHPVPLFRVSSWRADRVPAGR